MAANFSTRDVTNVTFSDAMSYSDADYVDDPYSHCHDYDKSGQVLLDNLGFYLEGVIQGPIT